VNAILINVIGILIGVKMGWFLRGFILFIEPIYIPLLFLFSGLYFAKGVNMYLYTVSCFLFLLLNDILFWFYSGVGHDTLSRSMSEILFYVILGTTTVALLFVKLRTSNRKIEFEPGAKLTPKAVLFDILFVLSISATTLLLFYQYNPLIRF
jgi:hypothetical protein